MNASPPMVVQLDSPGQRAPMPVFQPVPLGNRLPPEEREALYAEIEAMIARGNALREAQAQYGVLNREYFDDAWWVEPEVSWGTAAAEGVLGDRAAYQQNICPSRRSQADYEEDYMYRISSDFGSYFDRPSNDPSSPFGYSPMTSYASCPETSFTLNSSYSSCPGMDDSFDDVEDDFEDAAESFLNSSFQDMSYGLNNDCM
uniref:Uncharacterized protein n=1 Tax=Lygus hesperus TaxID=30085 RepID=A0A0K8SB20_LYGHE